MSETETNENEMSQEDVNEQADPQAQADNAEGGAGEGEGAASGDTNDHRPDAGAEGADGQGDEPENTEVAEEEQVVVIEPTIGRVVHLYEGTRIRTPRAAIVADVLDSGRINVGGFDFDGSRMNMSNIPLVQAHEEPPTSGWWATWMPYQVGQAAKNDDLVAILEERIAELENLVGL